MEQGEVVGPKDSFGEVYNLWFEVVCKNQFFISCNIFLVRISKYFGSVQFIKWDDTAEPIIRFSDDGSLAYAIVQKDVIVTYPDSTGNAVNDTTHYAWSSIYRKQNGQWKVECNISTNK